MLHPYGLPRHGLAILSLYHTFIANVPSRLHLISYTTYDI